MSRIKDAHSEEAYNRAIKGGINGGFKCLVLASVLCTLGHYTWPTFRRVTVQGKAYLISSFVVVGSVIRADREMLNYERSIARVQNIERREVYNIILERGGIPTESEVRKELDRRKATT